ncbi:GntR family transcriptional regulator, partial [Escherichia coli]|nr:GntR family transcriptional regulator [Escherichia coli]
SPRLTAHACIKKDVSLIKNKKYFTRQEYLYCARYVGFDCKSERRKHL